MRVRSVQDIEANISEVSDLIKILEERIAVIERDLIRIYELQELFKKCVEASSHG
ncbi:MAG: hypothetical protein QXZ48_07280 [Zestosphaera sp.]